MPTRRWAGHRRQIFSVCVFPCSGKLLETKQRIECWYKYYGKRSARVCSRDGGKSSGWRTVSPVHGRTACAPARCSVLHDRIRNVSLFLCITCIFYMFCVRLRSEPVPPCGFMVTLSFLENFHGWITALKV